MSKTIETDLKTFIKFWLVPFGILLAIAFCYSAKTALIVVGMSIFLALALRPLVRRVNNFFTRIFGGNHKHETLSVIMAYLIVVLVIGTVIAIIGPVVVSETSKFIQNFPETFENTFGGWDGINELGKRIGIDDLHSEIIKAVDDLSNNLLGMLGNNLFASVSGVADVMMKVVLILVLTLLFLLEGPALLNSMWRALGSAEEDRKPVTIAKRVVSRMANVVSTYVSRQAIVAVIDGFASGMIVFLLSLFTDVQSNIAIPMGLITMSFYLIPMFGQFIGGTLVTVLLFFSSPLAAVIFAIVYIVYAQIENNMIAPKIQGSALKLPAVIILVAIVFGMYMFGLLGAIIAVPIAGCIRVLMDEYPNIKAARR
ncbi:AI-2E family transporter [Candidatus Saccharibacteria bacterium]|nr:AI-2E family transporter [Candidatus Saccharibacteria bacterium]